MSHVLKVIEADIYQKIVNIAKKPKIGKLIVGKKGQLHPKAFNLRRNLDIEPTGMFTKSQSTKVFRTK